MPFAGDGSHPFPSDDNDTGNDVRDRLAVDAPASEGAVLSRLRSAIDVRDALERGRRRRRVGDAAPPPGRREGVQEVLADEARCRSSIAGPRVGGSFGTGGMTNRGYSGTVGRSSGTVSPASE